MVLDEKFTISCCEGTHAGIILKKYL